MSTLTKLNHKFQDYLALELEHTRPSVFYEVAPALKLLFTVVFIVLINNVVRQPLIWAGLALAIVGMTLALQINIIRFLRFWLVFGVFYPLLVALPLLFITPGSALWERSLLGLDLSITLEGAVVAGSYFLRIMATAGVIAFLISSTPFTQIIHAFRQLHLPGFVVSLMAMTYRYFFFFFDNLVTLVQADSTRHLQKLPFKARFRHLGNMLGNLLLRSIHQGASIHRAMVARGYTGEFPLVEFSTNPKITLVYSLLNLSGITLALLAQFIWLG